jgi:hypothetical protein
VKSVNQLVQLLNAGGALDVSQLALAGKDLLRLAMAAKEGGGSVHMNASGKPQALLLKIVETGGRNVVLTFVPEAPKSRVGAEQEVQAV